MDSPLTSCLTTPIIPEHYPSPSLSPERSIRKCSTIEDQPTIKMEDLEQQSNAATLGGAASSPTPSQDAPRSGEAKPVKKRKSWGQVLPEPKTNLPPRKRAKTADEKEQRRIERVKRNRLAAHNSRERKRQEVELLQNEKEDLEQRLREMEESHKKMAAELAAFRRMMPGVSPQPEPLDSSSLTSSTAVQDHAPSFDGAATPTSSSATINPRQASFPTPESMSMDSVDSPLDTSSQPATPAADEPTLADLDRTQHSAAMLCDLQCQSRPASSANASLRWAMILWYLSLLPMWSTLLSTVHSSILTTFASLLPPLRPNLRALARKRLCSMAIPISPRLLRSTSMARRLSTCTPTQAQQILLATSLASQPKSSSASVGRILRALMRSRPDDSFSGLAKGATRRSSPAAANSMATTCRRSKKTESRLQNNRATMVTAL
jgi:hypothetical protein